MSGVCLLRKRVGAGAFWGGGNLHRHDCLDHVNELIDIAQRDELLIALTQYMKLD